MLGPATVAQLAEVLVLQGWMNLDDGNVARRVSWQVVKGEDQAQKEIQDVWNVWFMGTYKYNV